MDPEQEAPHAHMMLFETTGQHVIGTDLGTDRINVFAIEGGKLAPAFEALLVGWKAQGYELVSLRRVYEGLGRATLPLHEVVPAALAGRSGALATQGAAYLAPRAVSESEITP